jgi:hypothetical protein
MTAGFLLLPNHRLMAAASILVCLIFVVSLGFNMVYALIIWGLLQLIFYRRQRPEFKRS